MTAFYIAGWLFIGIVLNLICFSLSDLRKKKERHVMIVFAAMTVVWPAYIYILFFWKPKKDLTKRNQKP